MTFFRLNEPGVWVGGYSASVYKRQSVDIAFSSFGRGTQNCEQWPLTFWRLYLLFSLHRDSFVASWQNLCALKNNVLAERYQLPRRPVRMLNRWQFGPAKTCDLQKAMYSQPDHPWQGLYKGFLPVLPRNMNGIWRIWRRY